MENKLIEFLHPTASTLDFKDHSCLGPLLVLSGLVAAFSLIGVSSQAAMTIEGLYFEKPADAIRKLNEFPIARTSESADGPIDISIYEDTLVIQNLGQKFVERVPTVTEKNQYVPISPEYMSFWREKVSGLKLGQVVNYVESFEVRVKWMALDLSELIAESQAHVVRNAGLFNLELITKWSYTIRTKPWCTAALVYNQATARNILLSCLEISTEDATVEKASLGSLGLLSESLNQLFGFLSQILLASATPVDKQYLYRSIGE